MKKQGKKLATLTMTLYEDRVEWNGMQPYHFKTQVEYIRAINVLLRFCWVIVQRPAESIPGWELLNIGNGGRIARIPRKKGEQVLPGVAYVAEPES